MQKEGLGSLRRKEEAKIFFVKDTVRTAKDQTAVKDQILLPAGHAGKDLNSVQRLSLIHI